MSQIKFSIKTVVLIIENFFLTNMVTMSYFPHVGFGDIKFMLQKNDFSAPNGDQTRNPLIGYQEAAGSMPVSLYGSETVFLMYELDERLSIINGD